MAKKKQVTTVVAADKVVLGDTKKRQRKESAEGKLNGLSGKIFDDLKSNEKDQLLRAFLESVGWIDLTGKVV